MLTKTELLADAELAALAGPETDDTAPGVPYPLSQDQTILDVLRARTHSVVGSITVQQLFDQLYSTGEYMALKQAQMANEPEAVMAFAVVSDATQYGKGQVQMGSEATSGLFNTLASKGLIHQSSIDALTALATRTVSAADDYDVSSNMQIAAILGRGNPFGG